jgi:hypothetical protein
MEERFVFNAVLARSRVVDKGGDQVKNLKPETNYNHGLELVRNLSLWPLEITVRSCTQDKARLRYLGVPGEDWEFIAQLNPNHGSGERVVTIECLKGASGQCEIVSNFSTDGGYQDVLGLGVRIG